MTKQSSPAILRGKTRYMDCRVAGLSPSPRSDASLLQDVRHCEERSDEAIQVFNAKPQSFHKESIEILEI